MVMFYCVPILVTYAKSSWQFPRKRVTKGDFLVHTVEWAYQLGRLPETWISSFHFKAFKRHYNRGAVRMKTGS
jgi:hypothetical protein